MQFGSQDFQLTQPQKTLAYAKAIQHWVEKAQALTPGEPCQLAEMCWNFDMRWSLWLHSLMRKYWKMSCPPIGSGLHPLDQQSLPKEITAIAGCAPLMLRDHSQLPTVRTATSHSYHSDGKSTNCSSPGGDATRGRSQQSMPNTPTRVCRNCMIHVVDKLPRVVTGVPPELAEDQGPIQMVGSSSMLSNQLF